MRPSFRVVLEGVRIAYHALSAKVNGKKHPAVLWLVNGQGGKLPRVVHDETAERAVFEAEVPAGGKTQRFSIVIVGKAAE